MNILKFKRQLAADLEEVADHEVERTRQEVIALVAKAAKRHVAAHKTKRFGNKTIFRNVADDLFGCGYDHLAGHTSGEFNRVIASIPGMATALHPILPTDVHLRDIARAERARLKDMARAECLADMPRAARALGAQRQASEPVQQRIAELRLWARLYADRGRHDQIRLIRALVWFLSSLRTTDEDDEWNSAEEAERVAAAA